MPAIVWIGAEALKAFLVPIDELEPFPDNPRRGDVAGIRASLRRFGQTKPITTNGKRIVAGHHVVLAAKAEGWTHVGAMSHEFVNDEEARAYLAADNGIHERGSYDDALLALQLRALATQENGLAGTGYDDSALRELETKLAKLRDSAAPVAFPTINPDELETAYCCPACGFEWAGKPKPPRQ